MIIALPTSDPDRPLVVFRSVETFQYTSSVQNYWSLSKIHREPRCHYCLSGLDTNMDGRSVHLYKWAVLLQVRNMDLIQLSLGCEHGLLQDFIFLCA